MDVKQIERLEALLANVPKGEWECHPAMAYSICLPDDSYIDISLHHRSDEEETAARDLIVAAVNALPALLQLARAELRRQNARDDKQTIEEAAAQGYRFP